MENCIFCKIASGEIPKTPAEKKFEDDNFIAFLDIHPKAPGHTILIPKAHYRWFIDMPEELSDGLFRAAKKVAKQLKDE
jgi:histidine triad (HIT) family protein